MSEMTRAVVRVREGIRIHYRRLGRGPAMVLLHGFPQTGHIWRKVMPALGERFTVVAPDLRGYGDSDRPRDGYDKRTMAGDVADLIRQLDLGPVVLVGHDRGGRVAHRFALDHPALLTRLVLLDIAPTYDIFHGMDYQGARERWHWIFHLVPDLPEALVAGREEIYLRFLFRAWALDPAALEEEAVQEYLRCFRQAGAMHAAFEDYRAGGTLDLEHDGADRDKKIAVPTLVLWGAAGRPPQSSDMLGVWKARGERVEGFAIPGSGHFIAEEQPAALVEAIRAFVK
ncbi:MAG: alpha/beta fold hydrolase [Candidatus Rokuibacteriota bacterium]